MIKKAFECTECGTFGKISIVGEDHQSSDIVYCPLCSGDILDDDDLEKDE